MKGTVERNGVMRRAIGVMASLVALALVALPVAAFAQQPTPEITFDKSTLVIHRAMGGDVTFNVEMAVTPEQQERGLMYRKSVPPYHGMLFDFGTVRPIAMWMKNTLIPLDMIFMAANGRIVYIASNTVPESTDVISAGQPVLAVLEISGGSSMLLGIHRGDMADHPIFKRAQ